MFAQQENIFLSTRISIWEGETEKCFAQGEDVTHMEDLCMHSLSLSHLRAEWLICGYDMFFLSERKRGWIRRHRNGVALGLLLRALV